jgi:hypothetical protein
MRAGSQRSSLGALTLAALGIVFGDIGTSPLYAVKETFSPGHGIPLTEPNILGGLSTIFWALMIVVSLKYVVLIMRADNRGEGGIMALIALASTAVRDQPQWRLTLTLIGLAGASLFYGDAVLTPAISVLSAVEGLGVVAPALDAYVVPIAVVILIALLFSLLHTPIPPSTRYRNATAIIQMKNNAMDNTSDTFKTVHGSTRRICMLARTGPRRAATWTRAPEPEDVATAGGLGIPVGSA